MDEIVSGIEEGVAMMMDALPAVSMSVVWRDMTVAMGGQLTPDMRKLVVTSVGLCVTVHRLEW